ncbi:MAG TPA: response regulator [Candidatus Eisenbergiella merdipullorum]|uniref:Stage 0 sporulation protein A homolog n=1 Tax=Candidatus Eisenbergiella merdipullorum TaxID=2838553 RepID=A0A9D2I1I0_9FIRM|nr:response regulator [Candidatus Eisenbergiella merdipullorum]
MYRLIIIDDDAGTSNNLGNYFPWEEHGFQVMEKFYDGYTACEYLKKHTVDLIISDIKMPVMDGIELAKWLYEQGSKPLHGGDPVCLPGRCAAWQHFCERISVALLSAA